MGNSAGDLFAGVFGLVLGVLVIVLAVFWLIFPWMVYAQLQSLIQGLKKLDDSQNTMQHVLIKIERNLDGIEASLHPSKPLVVRIDSTSQATETAARPKASYYYSTDGTQQGPLTSTDLIGMRTDGLITDDTPVLREGESQWKTYRDFIQLNRKA